MSFQEHLISPARDTPEIDHLSKYSPSNNSSNGDLGNAKGVAATRAARTRDWPERSDAYERFPSLQDRIHDQQGVVVATTLGMDSGRNLFGIFEDEGDKLRLKYNLQIRNGRPKTGYPAYRNPKDWNLPVGITLKQICTYYPAHCWGDGLRLFIAEGWTAQEIWEALPKETRNKGAHVRPWNYLQQAMGREVDKMRVEEGLPARKIAKRKHTEVEDEQNDVRIENLRPSITAAPQQPSALRGAPSLAVWARQQRANVPKMRQDKGRATTKRPRYEDPTTGVITLPGLRNVSYPILASQQNFLNRSTPVQEEQFIGNNDIEVTSLYDPIESQYNLPASQGAIAVSGLDFAPTTTTQANMTASHLHQLSHRPQKRRLIVNEGGSPAFESALALSGHIPPLSESALQPVMQPVQDKPAMGSNPMGQRQPVYPSPVQVDAGADQHYLSVSPEDAVWNTGLWPPLPVLNFDLQTPLNNTSDDPIKTYTETLDGMGWGDFDHALDHFGC